jgi:hypothetical protein
MIHDNEWAAALGDVLGRVDPDTDRSTVSCRDKLVSLYYIGKRARYWRVLVEALEMCSATRSHFEYVAAAQRQRPLLHGLSYGQLVRAPLLAGM